MYSVSLLISIGILGGKYTKVSYTGIDLDFVYLECQSVSILVLVEVKLFKGDKYHRLGF